MSFSKLTGSESFSDTGAGSEDDTSAGNSEAVSFVGTAVDDPGLPNDNLGPGRSGLTPGSFARL